MRQIEIRITEDVILNNTWYTVEQLAEANSYQETIVNPDYVPQVGMEWDENYAPEQGTPTIPNPETCVQFLAKKGLETMVRNLAQPLLRKVAMDAEEQAITAFNQALEAVIENSQITTVE